MSHQADNSHRGALFVVLAHSQLRYMAAMMAVLQVIEGQAKAPCGEGA